MKRRIAPWKDYHGNSIYEGSVIVHPSGEMGTIVFIERADDPEDQWRVAYGKHDLSRLCLQIGDKGQAFTKESTISDVLATERELFEISAVRRGEYRIVRNSKRRRRLLKRGERIWWSRYFHGWVWDYLKLPF